MIIKIFWSSADSQKLFEITNEVLNELWIWEFITLERTEDANYKEELAITAEPAFCIEEESIEFKDVIFEWMVPEKSDITNMILSIVWWEEDWCGGWSCDWCWHWWGCH